VDECGICDGNGCYLQDCDNYPQSFYDCYGVLAINESFIPTRYELSQNYPNPFNPVTYIQYSVPFYDYITIDIINIRGQIINTIVQGSHQPGNYEIIWDGKNHYGASVPSGIYFYKMDAMDFISIKKLIIIK
jgi:hypothetical protein